MSVRAAPGERGERIISAVKERNSGRGGTQLARGSMSGPILTALSAPVSSCAKVFGGEFQPENFADRGKTTRTSPLNRNEESLVTKRGSASKKASARYTRRWQGVERKVSLHIFRLPSALLLLLHHHYHLLLLRLESARKLAHH